MNAEIRGAEDFLRLSKALKQAGRAELRKELNKGLRQASKPLIAATREAARRDLPKAGGLADLVARTPQRVQVRTGAATAGVRIVVLRSKSGAQRANRGILRHPVFARGDQTRDEWTWVDQKIDRPGWFDLTLSHNAPAVRVELQKALEAVAHKVIQGAR